MPKNPRPTDAISKSVSQQSDTQQSALAEEADRALASCVENGSEHDTEDSDCATRHITAVMQLFKSRIGLSKSATFNDSVVEIATRDHEAVRLADLFMQEVARKGEAKAKKENPPLELIAYLRGVKNAQMYVLQMFRTKIFEAFDQSVVARFDESFESCMFLRSADNSLHNKHCDFWSEFGAFLNERIDSVIGTYVLENFQLPLFRKVLETIESSIDSARKQGGQAMLSQLASTPFSFKLTIPFTRILANFNAAHDPDEPETVNTSHHAGICTLVEEDAGLIGRYSNKGVTKDSLRLFLGIVADADNPRKGLCMQDMYDRYGTCVDQLEIEQEKSSKRLWGAGKKSEREELLEKERAQSGAQIVWYAQGALHAMDILLLQEFKAAAQNQLKAGREFYEIVQISHCGIQNARKFFQFLIIKRFEQRMSEVFHAFVHSLRQEAALKSFNDDCYYLKPAKGAVRFTLDVFLKQNMKFVSILRTVLRVSPTLETELATCPSIAYPLAANFARFHKKDPARAKAILKSRTMAARMAALLRMDHLFKDMLTHKALFFALTWKTRKDPAFLSFLQAVVDASPQARKPLLESPGAIAALWRMHHCEPEVGIHTYLLGRPQDLLHFIDLHTDEMQLAQFADVTRTRALKAQAAQSA